MICVAPLRSVGGGDDGLGGGSLHFIEAAHIRLRFLEWQLLRIMKLNDVWLLHPSIHALIYRLSKVHSTIHKKKAAADLFVIPTLHLSVPRILLFTNQVATVRIVRAALLQRHFPSNQVLFCVLFSVLFCTR